MSSVICLAGASSSQTSSVAVSATVRPQPPKELIETQPELRLSYELQQGYRILRELTTDSNKSFVSPFVNPLDPSSPDYAEYHRRVRHPVWLSQSKQQKQKMLLTAVHIDDNEVAVEIFA